MDRDGTYCFTVGDDGTAVVTRPDGTELTPALSREWVRHSDRFDWGYGGAAPAQLSYALLLDLTGDAEFTAGWYQSFKWSYLAALPTPGKLPVADLRAWVARVSGGIG